MVLQLSQSTILKHIELNRNCLVWYKIKWFQRLRFELLGIKVVLDLCKIKWFQKIGAKEKKTARCFRPM